MCRNFLIVLAVCMMCGATLGRAAPSESCDLIVTLTGLPDELATVREGRSDPEKFRHKLYTILGALKDNRRVAVFKREELRALRIFAGTVREDWKMNGTSPNGRQIPGLTTTSSTIGKQLNALRLKFGCEIPATMDSSPLQSTNNGTISLLTVTASLAIVVGILSLVYKVFFSRRHGKRRICLVPALLSHGRLQSETVILDISNSGAKVQAPEEELSTDNVDLNVPGYRLAARVVWRNSNFIGLSFDKMLSNEVADEIAMIKPNTVQMSDLAEAPAK